MNLYRRHRRDCKAERPEDSLNGEFEERRKGWKRCNCPIFASQSTQGKRQRKSTGQWEWDEAKTVVASWEGTIADLPAPTPPKAKEVVTVPQAIDAFLLKCKNKGIVHETYRKYLTFTKQLKIYCDDCGYLNIEQLTLDDAERFYATWKDGAKSKGKKLDKFRAFTIMQRDGFRCTTCGRDASDGVRLQVDHLKARSLYPELERELTNLKTACSDCNIGKGQRAARNF